MSRLAPQDERAARGLHGAGVYHALPEARLLSMGGPDAARYLQAMLTQDLSAVERGGLVYAALADDRGRYLADFWVWRPGSAWMLEAAAGVADGLARRLALFAVSDRVEVAEEERRLFHVEGSAARHVVRALVGRSAVAEGREGTPAVAEVRIGATRAWLARRTRYGEPGATFAVAADQASGFAVELDREAQRAGLVEAGEAARATMRIEAGRPLGGVDVTANDLIQEAGLARALSLAKGCYPGQETVRSVAGHGGLRRRLAGLTLDREAAASPLGGAAVEEPGGRRIGSVTSAADSPALAAAVALAWVEAERWQPASAVCVRARGGLYPGTISELPFVSGSAGPVAEVPRYPERTAATR